MTYAELDWQARALAARLTQHAVPGDRALLLYPQSLDFIVAFFGCLYAGIVAIPAYPPRPNQSGLRIQAIAEDAEPRLALTPCGSRCPLAGAVCAGRPHGADAVDIHR